MDEHWKGGLQLEEVLIEVLNVCLKPKNIWRSWKVNLQDQEKYSFENELIENPYMVQGTNSLRN